MVLPLKAVSNVLAVEVMKAHFRTIIDAAEGAIERELGIAKTSK